MLCLRVFINSQFALPEYFCFVVLGCKVIALTPNFSSLIPASGIIILSRSQPALILIVNGVLYAYSITELVISSIKHKSFKAAEPPPLFVTFGTGQP